MDLLICDGDENRLNRRNIFNPLFNQVGIFSCPHKDKKHVTVIVYCGLFTKDGEESRLDEMIQAFMAEPVPAPPLERHLYKEYGYKQRVEVRGNEATRHIEFRVVFHDDTHVQFGCK